MRAKIGWLIGIGIIVALLVASRPMIRFCDGNAPGWVENRGGCATWSPIEYLYPWHWGVPDQCLGLCEGSLLPAP
jgi:hypothetical protein